MFLYYNSLNLLYVARATLFLISDNLKHKA